MAADACVVRPLIGVAWDLPLWTFQDKKFVVLSICGLSKVRYVVRATQGLFRSLNGSYPRSDNNSPEH